MLRDLIRLSETAAASEWRQWILPSVSSMGSSSWVVQTSLHHAVAEDDPKIWTYPKQPDVNKGEVFSVDSPSDVKAGTFVGYQVPQELSVLSHSLLHIHFLLLRHTHLCHDEPPRIYRRQTQTRRHSAVLTQLTLSWKMSFFHLISRAGVCKLSFYAWRHLKGHTHGTDIIEFAAMNAVGCVALHLLHLTQRAALEHTTMITAGDQPAQTFCTCVRGNISSYHQVAVVWICHSKPETEDSRLVIIKMLVWYRRLLNSCLSRMW